MPFKGFTALKLFTCMNQYAVYYPGLCSHHTHVFRARVCISKVFFCGQLAVSIIEEQWDQKRCFGYPCLHASTREIYIKMVYSKRIFKVLISLNGHFYN